jgi:hypothetical protein
MPRSSLGLNGGLRAQKPATNSLSYGTDANFPSLLSNYRLVSSESIIDTKFVEIEEAVLLGCTNSDSENWHNVSYVSTAVT